MDRDGAGGVRRRLEAHPSSVAEARSLVRQALVSAGRGDLVDDAVLLVSEVVTNALVHAGTAVDVTAAVGASGLRVEVADGSRHLPATRSCMHLAGTGRGLRMLEQLVDHWGVEPSQGGKTVWFELQSVGPYGPDRWDRGAAAARAPEGGVWPDAMAQRPAGALQVVLLNVPLLLYAAWQVHAESLLREHLLTGLDGEGAAAAIEAHAAATDAMALLREQIPSPELGDDPGAVLAAAEGPLRSCARLELVVPRPSVPHFRLLGEMLDAAIDMADSGALLTPPIQPELRAFRRWVCRQVLDQSEGALPVAWSELTEAPPPPHAAVLSWDSSSVTGAARSLVAADETNRILALSRPALSLLGYDADTDLVGHRLVEIIPRRYRQAHLAGFTLHLATGRSPLLGQPVMVPVLRRDGGETPVELTVEVCHLPGGDRIFVGEMRALPATGGRPVSP